MKTTQYVRQEKAIASADSGGIRERWRWGLRLLRDPEAMSSEKSLKHGVTDQLVAAAAARGLKLSDREIRRRLQCARTYQTEAEIGQVLADFGTWDGLGDQASLFPLRDFEPYTTTLKELQDYTEEMEELTARFAARDRERRAYLESLIEAADDDLSMTWQDAHQRLAETGRIAS